jgi:hypothetical protein
LQPYKMVIIQKSYSLLLNKIEREIKVDTFYAPNDNDAYDSCRGEWYGRQFANNEIKKIYENLKRMDQYPYHAIHLESITVYNKDGLDVSTLVSDSFKTEMEKKYH